MCLQRLKDNFLDSYKNASFFPATAKYILATTRIVICFLCLQKHCERHNPVLLLALSVSVCHIKRALQSFFVCAIPVWVHSDTQITFLVKCLVHKAYPIFDLIAPQRKNVCGGAGDGSKIQTGTTLISPTLILKEQ